MYCGAGSGSSRELTACQLWSLIAQKTHWHWLKEILQTGTEGQNRHSLQRRRSQAKAIASAQNTNCVSKVDPRKQRKFPETTVVTMMRQSKHFTAVCGIPTCRLAVPERIGWYDCLEKESCRWHDYRWLADQPHRQSERDFITQASRSQSHFPFCIPTGVICGAHVILHWRACDPLKRSNVYMWPFIPCRECVGALRRPATTNYFHD